MNVAGTQVLTWTFVPLLLQSADPRLLFVAGVSHITLASEAYFSTEGAGNILAVIQAFRDWDELCAELFIV